MKTDLPSSGPNKCFDWLYYPKAKNHYTKYSDEAIGPQKKVTIVLYRLIISQFSELSYAKIAH